MKKQNLILSAALAAVFSASTAFAEAEVTGKIVHESGFYSNAGSTIGDFGVSKANGSGGSADYTGVTTTATPSHAKRDAFKRETTAKIYIDGEANELTDGATFHVELNLMKDSKATSNYDSNESYTQRDALREAYVDSQVGDWSLRTGKQQVVWGTADGMKLLDIINPTDYSEMAQNQMEDSRIPVWMINAETTIEDGTEFQVILSQPKENLFAGLNRNVNTLVRQNLDGTGDDITLNDGTDTGHAFMMKGPNTITGARDGFLNIVPDMGGVASRFAMAFTPTAITGGDANGNGSIDGAEVAYDPTKVQLVSLNDASMQGFTVGILEQNSLDCVAVMMGGGDPSGGCNDGSYNGLPQGFRNAIDGLWANMALPIGQGGYGSETARNTALGITQAGDLTGKQLLAGGFQPLYNTNLANNTDAQDTAFDYMTNTTFRTFDRFVNAGSQYVYNMPKNGDVDLAIRTKKSLPSGLNYSLVTSYNYDKNPIINLSWRNKAGALLTNDVDMVCPAGPGACGSAATYTLGALTDAAGNEYGGDADMAGQLLGKAAGTYAPILRFEEEVKRVLNVGGSFDMSIETAEFGPVVIRGEALYTKGTYSPIIDKNRLSYGDLPGALTMQKGDRAKFVLGADITALTNMMISAQFIQDSDLDFVDGDKDAGKYTADYATMHLSNGFNKSIKDKNFYSLFFSKPFGASGEHRWNNITMLEEGVNGNGKWNRLDAEFSIDDNTQATVEFNKYWGDENTQFGQLEKSSNIQVGVKYSF